MDKLPHHISTLRGTAKTVICTERRFSPLDCQLPLLTHLKYYILLRLKNTAAETQSSWDAGKSNNNKKKCRELLNYFIPLEIQFSVPESRKTTEVDTSYGCWTGSHFSGKIALNITFCFSCMNCFLPYCTGHRGAVLMEC